MNSVKVVQPIIRDTSIYFSGKCHSHGEQFVECPVCKQEVSLSISYYDPYLKGGRQVHKKCLSEERKSEIAKVQL